MRTKVFYALLVAVLSAGCEKDEDQTDKETTATLAGWWDVEKVKAGDLWYDPPTSDATYMLFTDDNLFQTENESGMVYLRKDDVVECCDLKNYSTVLYRIDITSLTSSQLTASVYNVKSGTTREYLMRRNAARELFIHLPKTYLQGEWKANDAKFSKIVFDDKYATFFFDGEDAHKEMFFYYRNKYSPQTISISLFPESEDRNVIGYDLYYRILIESVSPVNSPNTFRINDYKNSKTYTCVKQ